MKVLVALDDSDTSVHAAAEAVRLFGPLDAEFLVINVAQMRSSWLFPAGFGGIAPMPAPDLRQLIPPSDRMAAAVSAAHHAGLDDAELIADVGDPTQCICARAEEHDVDIVVVGSHDRGILSRLISASTASGVMRGTCRPVLVVSDHSPVHPEHAEAIQAPAPNQVTSAGTSS